MSLNIIREIDALKPMTLKELREKYQELFGEESRSNNKQFLFKRLAWRIQALKEGGLSERARKRAQELAREADLRIRTPKGSIVLGDSNIENTSIKSFSVSYDRRIPLPGTILERQYQGKTVRVMVLPKGFEYEGRNYRSLSAVAKTVTNSHWNGFGFFGLIKKGTRSENERK